jgi:uncharacterized SAM-binding protein YcdF (DUF218 family)
LGHGAAVCTIGPARFLLTDIKGLETTSSSPFRGIIFLLRAVAFAAVIYAAGFLVFLFTLPKPNGVAPEGVTADAIVVLTGQDRRLEAAVDLLERGAGQRLLITGVNPETKKEELRQLLSGGKAFDCCADLGFEAADTRGNAHEAAAWANAHGYNSLVVVTGFDHMPRSLLEFAAEMPDVMLIPYPVGRPNDAGTISGRLPRLHGEYAKYLASWARITLMPGSAAS